MGALPPSALAAGSDGAAAIDELFLPPDRPPSRVARVTSSHVVVKDRVHPRVLAEMLEDGLSRAVGVADSSAAWGALLSPDDVIGIKFDPLAQRELGTADALAEALVASLEQAGWEASRIVLIHVPEATAERLGTRPALAGFDDQPVDAGGRPVRLLSALRQVTALISVAPVRTDNVCVMRGTLANVSMGLIREEAALRRSDCAPAVAVVASLPQIRSKLRLAIADGLRAVFRDGPLYSADAVASAGVLLLSTDPVATDAIALELLNDLRTEHGMGPLATAPAEIPTIAQSHQAGLGIALRRRIDVIAARR